MHTTWRRVATALLAACASGAFATEVGAMSDVFGRIPKLTTGQRFSVDRGPGSGTVVAVDGKPVADAIPDEAFYDAVLRIGLGDDPADAGLKTVMLGGR